MSRRHTSNDSPAPRSYVVRVYRHTPAGLIGQVQDVQSGQVRAFRNIAGLWRALGGAAPPTSSRLNPSQEQES